ncbi:LuxR C-terminal-related transcriptional regulator [Streptosporangium sp. NPDC051023]|uniref:LuxR C-terminal-related transcriptional regulator n=1 Tax=Streptosporangium sp. NPDC051023 TaxID=3155410 RepID=UPI00344FED9D
MLHGRTPELLAVDGLLAEASSGSGGVLVVTGELGIGRSTLLDEAAARARKRGMRVLRAGAVARERGLPYAGVLRLFPAALETPRPRTGELTTGLRLLAMLGEAAADQPLACLVDDVQWLDEPTAEVLQFAARRLAGISVALLLAARDPLQPYDLATLRLGPLSQEDSAALLAERGHDLPAHTRRRITEASAGNPLALTEFAQTAGRPAQTLSLTVSHATAARVLATLPPLPAATTTMLLLCAVGGTAEPGTLAAAALALGAGFSDLCHAEMAGLVRIESSGVRFTHPLLGPALLRTAPITDRLAAHRALAAVLDPSRGALHRAASATGREPGTADLLERVAAALPGPAQAAAVLQESARLTPVPGPRARRLSAAASGAADLGLAAHARNLAARATALAPDAGVRLELARVEARLADRHPTGPVEGLLLAGDDRAALTLASARVRQARDTGLFGLLPRALGGQAEALLHLGEHDAAREAAREGLEHALDGGQDRTAGRLRGMLAWLDAVSGTEPPRDAVEAGSSFGRWALGLFHLGWGRNGLALEALLGGPLHPRSVPDLVEAAAGAGEAAACLGPLARFEEWAAGTGRPEQAGLALRCRALLDGSSAERLLPAAAALLRAVPYEQARTVMLHGELLRRARQRGSAKRTLESAHTIFTRLGARPWAERALAELRAAASTPGNALCRRLTAQEERVVRLAATGHGNKEIAGRLGISPRTVGNHLYKAFSKLGVSSRGDLAAFYEAGV